MVLVDRVLQGCVTSVEISVSEWRGHAKRLLEEQEALFASFLDNLTGDVTSLGHTLSHQASALTQAIRTHSNDLQTFTSDEANASKRC